jgi:hypothetical protein
MEHSISPDVKLVKRRSLVMHAVRYLGAVTRCKFWTFETCTKREARQSRFGVWHGGERRLITSPMFHFTNRSPTILVTFNRIGIAKNNPR